MFISSELQDRIKYLEIENTRLRHAINNCEAEITYWKETAEHYKNELNKILDKQNNK